MFAAQVLDAPNLEDDFYLNLVDWSMQSLLAVGLGNVVYLWNSTNCKVSPATLPSAERTASCAAAAAAVADGGPRSLPAG